MINKRKLAILKEKGQKIRLQVLEEIYRTGKGHIGGTFSCVEILISLYYGGFVNLYPKREGRLKSTSKFILSKGHVCLALYAIFFDLGLISKRKFKSYGTNGGLGGQLDAGLFGVDFNTGSLGHSVGIGAGMGFALRQDKSSALVYTLIGDSELFEGSVWEGIIFAGDQKIKNLICIIDRNRFTVTEELSDNSIYLKLPQKLKLMNWNCLEIDGHDYTQINQSLKIASKSSRPTMIIANTIKGKGVSFMENGLGWYTQSPTEKEYLIAKKELLKKL